LDFGNTKITSLPKGLKVGSRLNISGTQITSLPKGLKVGENLLIMNTNLKKYTDEELRDMVKPGVIKGDIFRG
jgi:Leucine-rich repeat (LRR) protein